MEAMICPRPWIPKLTEGGEGGVLLTAWEKGEGHSKQREDFFHMSNKRGMGKENMVCAHK